MGKQGIEFKAACSVSQMATMVGLSRARFYELISEGVFLKPQYTTKTRRPFYRREAQEANVAVRRDQVGVNGEYVLFYDRAERSEGSSVGRERKSKLKSKDDAVSGFVSHLKGLGMSAVKSEDVAHAIQECFPDGVPERQDAETLRTIYRHLRCSNDV